jgi:tetratricopeptide (TPR) repeat protein
MRVAVKAANPANPENASWYRVHLGVELMSAGKKTEAEREFDIALKILPGYHLALAAKGRARIGAGDLDAAVEYYRQAQERVPLPDYAIALGDLYSKLGRTSEAQRQHELVEFIERTSAAGATYSRQLALFWADHDTKLDEALQIMMQERAARKDIYTCDALAWCLYKKGKLTEARESIEQAMRLGTRDARLFYHAGMIYEALGNRGRAAKFMKLALATDPSFDILHADVARQKIAQLDSRSNFSASTRTRG